MLETLDIGVVGYLCMVRIPRKALSLSLVPPSNESCVFASQGLRVRLASWPLKATTPTPGSRTFAPNPATMRLEVLRHRPYVFPGPRGPYRATDTGPWSSIRAVVLGLPSESRGWATSSAVQDFRCRRRRICNLESASAHRKDYCVLTVVGGSSWGVVIGNIFTLYTDPTPCAWAWERESVADSTLEPSRSIRVGRCMAELLKGAQCRRWICFAGVAVIIVPSASV